MTDFVVPAQPGWYAIVRGTDEDWGEHSAWPVVAWGLPAPPQTFKDLTEGVGYVVAVDMNDNPPMVLGDGLHEINGEFVKYVWCPRAPHQSEINRIVDAEEAKKTE